MNRRKFVLSTISGLVAGASGPGSLWAAANPRRRELIGFNLISWEASVLARAKPWRRAIDEIYAVGARRITVVPFELFSEAEGRLVHKSRFELTRGPGVEVLKDIADYARSKGLSVSIKPMIEIDNQTGEGAEWRGSLKIQPEKLDSFFESYQAYILPLARTARQSGAGRFYIGTELAGLVKNQAHHDHWSRLIKLCRDELGTSKCLLSYAANFNEYTTVPFWKELDEIGVDTYFPLVEVEEAKGAGLPSAELLKERFLEILERLHKFSLAEGRPMLLAEWGVVPLDMTTVEPSDDAPSETQDPQEALNAYQAMLEAIGEQGDWLRGADFWHWQVNPHEDSNYRVAAQGPIAQLIRWWISS